MRSKSENNKKKADSKQIQENFFQKFYETTKSDKLQLFILFFFAPEIVDDPLALFFLPTPSSTIHLLLASSSESFIFLQLFVSYLFLQKFYSFIYSFLFVLFQYKKKKNFFLFLKLHTKNINENKKKDEEQDKKNRRNKYVLFFHLPCFR